MYHTISDEEAGRLIAGIPAAAAVDQIAAMFKALGDPTRVRIVHLLSQAELCVHDLAQLLGVSQPAMSHHLRVLRMLRLVRTRREGAAIHYSLDDQHVADLLRFSSAHALHGSGGTSPDV
ncbi:MAG TPA: metalloregulator ArsR/SmtB family transcription factor [Spirochaetia bacterium]|nr:metalloregulator ArsR/SmtB family transcription factor [Spirochaetia bacterium]